MRGKNTIWLTLIALLLTSLMVSVGSGVTPVKISILPSRIPEQAGTLGHPDDSFEMAVEVEGVNDLWSIGVIIKYAPYGRPIVAGMVMEGDFLAQGGYDTNFVYKIDVFKGELKLAVTRKLTYPLPVEGASGDGIIATFVFTVAEAGSTDIEITEVDMRDSNFGVIGPFNTIGSKYYGCEANLINVNMPDGRNPQVGDTFTFTSKAKNFGDLPIMVKTRYDIERLEDGRRIKLYSGQTYYGGYLGADPPATWLYCDGYNAAGWPEYWTKWGASPWLDAIEDGNLVNSTGPPAGEYADSGFYTFEDVTLPFAGIYNVISNVDFYGYTKCTSTDHDIDPLAFTEDAGTSYSWMWCDSMGGTTDWSWTGLRYYKNVYNFPEYYGFPLTEEAVNNAELILEYYGPSGETLEVDALRMLVEFATIIPVEPPVHEIQPDEELGLTDVTWIADADHIGTYVVTATLEYTLTGTVEIGWPEGPKTRTFTFEIKP